MSARRIALVAAGTLARTVAVLGAGVALGSSWSHGQSGEPPHATVGKTGLRRVRSSSGTKPKAQAYVHFDPTGAIVGPSKKVVAVHHFATGQYCVEFDHSIHVTDDTYVLATMDYFWASGAVVALPYSFSSWCPAGEGFPNSVLIVTLDGTRAFSNAAVFAVMP